MDWDDVRAAGGASPAITVGETLDRHSLDELAARIAALEVEIERTRAEIERKRQHEAQASSVFKT